MLNRCRTYYCMIKEMLKHKCAQSLIWLSSWEFYELEVSCLKFVPKANLLWSSSSIFMCCNNVVATRFLCVLCVLLSAHDCVDSSMVKYVLPNNSQLLTIKVHRLLEYLFIFPYVFRMWNMLIVTMQSMRPSNLNSLQSCWSKNVL